MGTLSELINYIHSKSGVQEIKIVYKRKLEDGRFCSEILFEGLTNEPQIQPLNQKQVIKFMWEFKSSKICVLIGDELP